MSLKSTQDHLRGAQAFQNYYLMTGKWVSFRLFKQIRLHQKTQIHARNWLANLWISSTFHKGGKKVDNILTFPHRNLKIIAHKLKLDQPWLNIKHIDYENNTRTLKLDHKVITGASLFQSFSAWSYTEPLSRRWLITFCCPPQSLLSIHLVSIQPFYPEEENILHIIDWLHVFIFFWGLWDVLN